MVQLGERTLNTRHHFVLLQLYPEPLPSFGNYCLLPTYTSTRRGSCLPGRSLPFTVSVPLPQETSFVVFNLSVSLSSPFPSFSQLTKSFSFVTRLILTSTPPLGQTRLYRGSLMFHKRGPYSPTDRYLCLPK